MVCAVEEAVCGMSRESRLFGPLNDHTAPFHHPLFYAWIEHLPEVSHLEFLQVEKSVNHRGKSRGRVVP